MQLQPGDRVRSKVFQPGICDEHEEGEVVRIISSHLVVIDFDTVQAGIQTEHLERIQ